LNVGMMRGLSIPYRGALPNVQAASARWIAGALALTAMAWLLALAGLLSIANRVHDDVPVLLAVKLPLLASRPGLSGRSGSCRAIDGQAAGRRGQHRLRCR
jgi:hypothetical protein